jgi:transcriptional regulator NrdR family protein
MPENETKQPSCPHCGTELTLVHDDSPAKGGGTGGDFNDCKVCGRVFSTDDAGNLTLVSVGVFSEQTAEEESDGHTE